VDDITHLLQAMDRGEDGAAERLLTIVYDELRRLAARRLPPSRPADTLQATALVHEVWLRLGGERLPHWNDRNHFFAAAASAMRSILVDRARKRQSLRHGGGQHRVNIDDVQLVGESLVDDQVLAVHEALEKFAQLDTRKAELVDLRYFAGLTIEEAARALDISAPTAKRWWAYARAWLAQEIKL
jgi:RNA polymerase sigma factor (TIGR02999 family)